jgi:hypothetical protein
MSPSLPDLSTHPRRSRREPAELLLLVVAIVACVLSGRSSWSAWNGLRRAESSVARARQATDHAISRAREIRTRSRSETETLVSALLLTNECPPPLVLAELEELLPPDVRLDVATLRYAETLGIELLVVAQSASAYDRFLESLVASRRFARLVPGSETRDGELRSTIKATYVRETPR